MIIIYILIDDPVRACVRSFQSPRAAGEGCTHFICGGVGGRGGIGSV